MGKRWNLLECERSPRHFSISRLKPNNKILASTKLEENRGVLKKGTVPRQA
jgi:hypothetical protein